MNGYPERKMWPCRECHEVGATHCTDPELCGGTCEYTRADLVAEKDAEIERLRKALEQACDRADLVAASDNDEGYCELNQRLPVWEHRHKELAAYLRDRDARPPTGGEA